MKRGINLENMGVNLENMELTVSIDSSKCVSKCISCSHQSKDWTTSCEERPFHSWNVPFHFIFTGLSWGNKPGWDLISRRYSLESSCCEACSFHGDVTKRKLGLSSCHINIPTLLAKKKGIPNFPDSGGHNRNFPRSANPSVGTLGFADFPRSNSPTSAPCSEWRAETMTDVFWGVLKVDPQSHSFQY